jgi:hypothetical protein
MLLFRKSFSIHYLISFLLRIVMVYMMVRFHSYVFSITLFAYLFLGLYAILIQSIIAALLYFSFIVFFAFFIAYFCCTKCQSTYVSCLHKFPGILARLFRMRTKKRFTKSELYIIYITTSIIILIPQIWLWEIKIVFVLFWICVLFNVFENRILFLSYVEK